MLPTRGRLLRLPHRCELAGRNPSHGRASARELAESRLCVVAPSNHEHVEAAGGPLKQFVGRRDCAGFVSPHSRKNIGHLQLARRLSYEGARAARGAEYRRSSTDSEPEREMRALPGGAVRGEPHAPGAENSHLFAASEFHTGGGPWRTVGENVH